MGIFLNEYSQFQKPSIEHIWNTLKGTKQLLDYI